MALFGGPFGIDSMFLPQTPSCLHGGEHDNGTLPSDVSTVWRLLGDRSLVNGRRKRKETQSVTGLLNRVRVRLAAGEGRSGVSSGPTSPAQPKMGPCDWLV